MIQNRNSLPSKSTIVRSFSHGHSDAVFRGGRTSRKVRRHGRWLAAQLTRRPDPLTARMESARDGLVVAVLSMIVAGYAVAVLARIAVQYGL